MIKISQRLEALANLVPHGSAAADIGTDHALLPCYLVKKGISPRVVAVELQGGPYRAAEKNIKEQGLTGAIELRCGDGLIPLNPGEVEVVIIAGMGGNTIREILQKSPRVLQELERIVFQPMSGSPLLRSWLLENGWGLVCEDLILEDGRIFEILGAEKKPMPPLTLTEINFGPLLIKNRHPLLPALLKKELTGLQEIKRQLAKSTKRATEEKRQYFVQREKMVKELLEWLQAARQ